MLHNLWAIQPSPTVSSANSPFNCNNPRNSFPLPRNHPSSLLLLPSAPPLAPRQSQLLLLLLPLPKVRIPPVHRLGLVLSGTFAANMILF